MERWHVLQAKPRKERQVAVQLHQRGLNVYLPLIWVSPVNPRAERERPYFLGYLFAQATHLADAHSLLRWSPGLKQVLEFGGEPALVAGAFVAELQQRLERIRAVANMASDGRRAAPLLEIAEGPFSGFEGVFSLQLGAAARTHILLNCIEQHYWQLRQPGASALPGPAGAMTHKPASTQ